MAFPAVNLISVLEDEMTEFGYTILPAIEIKLDPGFGWKLLPVIVITWSAPVTVFGLKSLMTGGAARRRKRPSTVKQHH